MQDRLGEFMMLTAFFSKCRFNRPAASFIIQENAVDSLSYKVKISAASREQSLSAALL